METLKLIVLVVVILSPFLGAVAVIVSVVLNHFNNEDEIIPYNPFSINQNHERLVYCIHCGLEYDWWMDGDTCPGCDKKQ